MLIDPFVLVLLLLIAVLAFVLLVFSPLIIELRKPRDNGPRRIFSMPFERRMRTSPTKPIRIGPDLAGRSNIVKNLYDVLNAAGVKAVPIGTDTVRIFGDVVFSPHVEASDNIVAEGTLSMGDFCVCHRSIKAKGNLHVGNGVIVKGNVVSEANVTILDDAVIGGSVHSEGSVKIGENVFIALSVVASGDVELHENSEVKKNILTRGVIKVLRHPRVDLPSTIDEIG